MEPIKKSKNISLIVGLAIPVLMIVAVAGSIYIPQFFAPKPQYDFLYTNDYYGGPYGAQLYEVRNGRVVKNPPVLPLQDSSAPPYVAKPVPAPEPQLFRYDVKNDMSKEVAFEEAQNFSLTTDQKSPDGFEFRDGSRDGDFFPFGRGYDYNVKYLIGHGISRKLNISVNQYQYNPVRFLGWIKN
ncbi:MAG: hypothetical protein Q8Q94_03020 [bacterium]|nr:hypothetical protein [bacterium]MDZ4299518.1 hypothetical protein [Candidatus Sungbacteria bacterium]